MGNGGEENTEHGVRFAVQERGVEPAVDLDSYCSVSDSQDECGGGGA